MQLYVVIKIWPSSLSHDHETDQTYHASQFIFSFFYIFLFVQCGGLSWLHVSFLRHVKYTLSYRIVSYKNNYHIIWSSWSLSFSSSSSTNKRPEHFRPSFHYILFLLQSRACKLVSSIDKQAALNLRQRLQSCRGDLLYKLLFVYFARVTTISRSLSVTCD